MFDNSDAPGTRYSCIDYVCVAPFKALSATCPVVTFCSFCAYVPGRIASIDATVPTGTIKRETLPDARLLRVPRPSSNGTACRVALYAMYSSNFLTSTS